ncbi:single-stranded DNA-binding protein [Amycolatopsis sp. RTGN1]|uniref:single-stranded DNA-binding protein n=1 Tax=Amycolatopsis ponsaeliensis TaxID=2992142 RepID=UPI00254BDF17|nr:single-stranded DNA-binding protein [Amycolatopsis sp. RTGN1]
MNENTFVGNVTNIEGYRTTQSGDAELTFKIAIDNGYYDAKRRWISDTVFQKVVVYRALAENLQATFATYAKNGVGMRLIVVGKFRDDSFTPKGQDYPVTRTKFIATIAGPDLSFATADVTKVAKTATERGNDANREQLAAVAA